MEVIAVGDRHVVKCVHCGGSGFCQNALRRTTGYAKQSDGNYSHLIWLECQRCGRGPQAFCKEDSDWEYNHYVKPPLCAICGGKGYTTV